MKRLLVKGLSRNNSDSGISVGEYLAKEDGQTPPAIGTIDFGLNAFRVVPACGGAGLQKRWEAADARRGVTAAMIFHAQLLHGFQSSASPASLKGEAPHLDNNIPDLGSTSWNLNLDSVLTCACYAKYVCFAMPMIPDSTLDAQDSRVQSYCYFFHLFEALPSSVFLNPLGS